VRVTCPSEYAEVVRRVALTIVWINEDATVYPQHVEGVAAIAQDMVWLMREHQVSWQRDVDRAVVDELVKRGLVDLVPA
jgi:hypothetical protein